MIDLKIVWDEPEFEREWMCDTRGGMIENESYRLYAHIIPHVWSMLEKSFTFTVSCTDKRTGRWLETGGRIDGDDESIVIARCEQYGRELLDLVQKLTP